jgi:Na+-translocating ferredoxin:NAD+ oxidoreductase RNF subunit RnfB
MTFITAVVMLGALAVILVTVLAAANRLLFVATDARLEAVVSALPGTNCGACGQAGCAAFGAALIAADAAPAECTVSPADVKERLAKFLGVDVGEAQARVARLACAGGTNVALIHAHYRGENTCAAAAPVAGGGHGCAWGCLGFGDCERSCDFDAILMNEHALPIVDDDLCIACNDCVVACPQDLFVLAPRKQRLWVPCSNPLAGDELLQECQVACTACAKCAFDAPGVISMQDNLAVVDPAAPQTRAAIERCPTGAIVWLDEEGRSIMGSAARVPVRHRPRPVALS